MTFKIVADGVKMSISDFARLKGVAYETARQAIKAGRISGVGTGSGRPKLPVTCDGITYPSIKAMCDAMVFSEKSIYSVKRKASLRGERKINYKGHVILY